MKASSLAISTALLLVAIGPAATDEPTPASSSTYVFFLDGRPFAPGAITIHGDANRLAPGDAIWVGALLLTLGAAGEYRFLSSPEGVRLQQADGSTRWVAVRVGRNYGEGPDFVDGLAPLTEAEVRGLWGLQAATWSASCVAKAGWLDVSRAFVEVGQTSSEGGESLPALPAGLRYLHAGHFVGWKNLARLRDLEYLSVWPERDFDVRLIAGFERLRVLRPGWRRLKHVGALASMRALERLDLEHHLEVTGIDFARGLTQLRAINLGGTGVRDLTPLSGLARLEAIDVSGSRVGVLPDGPLPALRTLDMIASGVSDDAAAAFRRAHPHVRVRHRWNASLREAIQGATRVRVVAQASCSLEDASAVVDTTEAAAIQELLGLLEVDEDSPLAICGCLGGPEIEFRREDAPVESVALTCGEMLSWSGWPAQGQISEPRLEALVEWLARHGVTGPRDERREAQSRTGAR